MLKDVLGSFWVRFTSRGFNVVKDHLFSVSMDIPCEDLPGKMSPFRQVCHLTTNGFVRSIHNRFVSLTRNSGVA